MKMNLLHSAFILTILPVTSLFSSQPPASPADAASGAVSPQPSAAIVDQPAALDDMIAAAEASAAQKQVSPAPQQPAGMPDLLAAAGAKSPEADLLLSQAAQHVAALSKPEDKTIKANNAQPAEAFALADFRNKDGDVEGQQAAMDSLKDKKKSAEECESPRSTSLTGALAGALVGAYEVVRTGVKYVKDSEGRKLLDRLEQCEKSGSEFASSNEEADLALIGFGVKDSVAKNKTENVARMINGLVTTKAKVPDVSRRRLRAFVTKERDEEVDALNILYNEKINEVLNWYEARRAIVREKEVLRQKTFTLSGCNSDNEDELHLATTESLKEKLFIKNGKAKVAKITKKAEVAAAKSAASAAVPSPASAAGNL